MRGLIVLIVFSAVFSAGAQTPSPQPAPRVPVQQVAPPSALGRPATASPATTSPAPVRPPPVVQPPRNTHAVKPPGQRPAPPLAAAPSPPPPAPALAPAVPDPPPEPSRGASGLPLPRWASLRSEEVNLRAGPGTRYPVDWVYRRRDLPVEIEREFEVWRLIEDQDGVKGWVHQATLTGRRSFVVKGGDRTLRKSAADDGAPVAVLKPGVVGRIKTCETGKIWCEVQVGDYRGWLKRDEVWGTYPGEPIN